MFSPIKVAQNVMGNLKHGYQVGELGDLHLHGPRIPNRTINIFIGDGGSSGWSWGGFFGSAAGSFVGMTLNFLKLRLLGRVFGGANWGNSINRAGSYYPQYGQAGNIFGYGYGGNQGLDSFSLSRPSILNGTGIFNYGAPVAPQTKTQTETETPKAKKKTEVPEKAAPAEVPENNGVAAQSNAPKNKSPNNKVMTSEGLLAALKKGGAVAIAKNGDNQPISGIVTLGNINNKYKDEKGTGGWPRIFTVTDTQNNSSGNKYVFQFVKEDGGKPVYKVLDENPHNNTETLDGVNILGESSVDEAQGEYNFNSENSYTIDSIDEKGIHMHTVDENPASRRKS